MSTVILNATGPNCLKTQTTESKHQVLTICCLETAYLTGKDTNRKGKHRTQYTKETEAGHRQKQSFLHMTHQSSSQNSSNEIKEVTIYDTDHEEDRMVISMHAPSVDASNSVGGKNMLQKTTNRSTYNNQGVTSLPPSHE